MRARSGTALRSRRSDSSACTWVRPSAMAPIGVRASQDWLRTSSITAGGSAWKSSEKMSRYGASSSVFTGRTLFGGLEVGLGEPVPEPVVEVVRRAQVGHVVETAGVGLDLASDGRVPLPTRER